MTELILRTAVVLGADQSKKLYTVQLCDNPPDIRPAIPLGGLHTFSNDTGVVSFVSYNIGDKVLVVSPSAANSRTNFCWIFGLLPLEAYSGDPDDYEEFSIFPGELSKLSTQLSSYRNDILQTPEFLYGYDAREHSPIDLKLGDWSVNGENTLLSVSDHNVTIKSGKALIFTDSIFNSITESSLFRSIYTAGERTRTRYYLGNLLFTREISGNMDDSYSKEPIFRHQEQLSDVLHGYRRAVLNEDGAPISLHTEELNGRVSTLSAGVVELGRSCNIPWYSLKKDTLVTTNGGEGLPETTPEDPLEYVNNSEDWLKNQLYGEPGTVYETTFDLANETEWEVPDTEDTSSFYDPYTQEEITVSNKKSGITCLPDGTILIRDGFGSEIRMCHGNIQISSANNTTILSGRDILQIAPGMVVSNAGEGIELGSGKGAISICTPDAIKVSSKKYSLSTYESIRVVEDKDVFKSNILNIQSNVGTLVGKASMTVVSPDTRISGDSRVAINTAMSAMCFEGNGITLGATVLSVHSDIQVATGKFTLSDTMTSNYESKDVIVPVTAGTVTVGGTVVVNKNLAVNDSIQTPAGIYSKFFAAKDVPAMAGVYTLKKAPEKVNLPNIGKEYKKTLGETVKSILKSLKEYFTEKALSLAKKVFTRESKACKIYNPPFGMNGNGGGSIQISSCSAGSGEVSYIYPGKRFWENEGLVTEEKDRVNMSDNRGLSYAGVMSVSVSKTNVINKED